VKAILMYVSDTYLVMSGQIVLKKLVLMTNFATIKAWIIEALQ